MTETLSVAQDTLHKLNQMSHLNRFQKRKIRIEGIKRLIRENRGTKFTATDLMRAGGYITHRVGDRGYNAGVAFLFGLNKRGIIIKDESDKMKTSYSLADDILVRKLRSDEIVTDDEVRAVHEDGPEETTENKDSDVHVSVNKERKLAFEFTAYELVEDDNFESRRRKIASTEMSGADIETIRNVIENVLQNV